MCCNLFTTKFHHLSVSTSYNKSVKIRHVATFHLQTCCNLLKQLVTSLWITSFDNQLATNLLTTCNRFVVNELSQAMRTHPDIGLLIKYVARLQNVKLLQVARFWLCSFQKSKCEDYILFRRASRVLSYSLKTAEHCTCWEMRS